MFSAECFYSPLDADATMGKTTCLATSLLVAAAAASTLRSSAGVSRRRAADAELTLEQLGRVEQQSCLAHCQALARLRGGGADEKVEGHCIGIDLGTTYSCVGVWQNGRVEIIANDQGSRITPSYVAWTSDDQRLIGDAAKNQASSNPENTVFDAKRMIGRKFSDPYVQADMKHWPFKVVEGNAGKPKIVVEAKGTKEFSAEEVRRALTPTPTLILTLTLTLT